MQDNIEKPLYPNFAYVPSHLISGAFGLIEAFWQGTRRIRDLVLLTKPLIVVASVMATATGFLWASVEEGGKAFSKGWPFFAMTLIATALAVGGACAINMWWERDLDRLMQRTRARPLPTGHLSPAMALGFGLLLGTVGIALFFWWIHPLSAALALLALLSYTLLYTPLKPKTPWAFLPGLLPGALPVLIGWTAATQTVSWAGWVLFGLLAMWQIPHSLSISLYLQEDYARAKIRTWAAVYGSLWTKRWLFACAVGVVLVSLALIPLAPHHWLVGAVAGIAGSWFLLLCWRGFGQAVDEMRWARQVFRASLIHLTLLFVALGIETLL